MRAKLIGGLAAAALAAVAAALLWSHSSSTAGTTSGASSSAAGTTAVSPYIDASLSPVYDMAGAARKTGAKDFTLGFVVSDGGCHPTWGGRTSLGHSALNARITALRNAGGDVRVSFGGMDGTELSRACGSVAELTAAYRTVISQYRLTRLDFDIEGDALSDTAANTRRAQAIAQLQKDTALDVTFTLPAMPDGLAKNAVALLADAKQHGAHLKAVNIMAMDYSESRSGDMSRYAIQAATATHAQIQDVLGLSGTAAWEALGVTPMIGVNDIAGEVFTLKDAAQLATFARDRHIGLLSMWAAERDQKCAGGTAATAQLTCSGVAQEPFAFTKALADAARRTGA